MKSIVSKIRNIGNKPEKTRIKIMWASVAVCMVLVVFVWITEFFGKKDNLLTIGDVKISESPNFNSTMKKISDIEKEKDKALDDITTELEKVEMAEIGIRYIDENKVLNGISINDIKLVKEEKSDGNWRLEFRQLYKGIPVELSGIILLIGAEDKNVKIEKNIQFSDIETDVALKITQEEALTNVRNAIKLNNAESKKSEVVIFTEKSAKGFLHRLAWKINAYNEEPFFGAVYFVDAEDGKILNL